MSRPATFLLRDDRDRQLAVRFVMHCPLGQQVKITKPTRTLEQNKHLHGCLSDIADQVVWPADTGELHDLEYWKPRLTLTWLIEKKREYEIITALESNEVGILLPHTSDLTTEQCAEFIEFLYMFGATNGVTFKEKRQPEPPPPETDR